MNTFGTSESAVARGVLFFVHTASTIVVAILIYTFLRLGDVRVEFGQVLIFLALVNIVRAADRFTNVISDLYDQEQE